MPRQTPQRLARSASAWEAVLAAADQLLADLVALAALPVLLALARAEAALVELQAQLEPAAETTWTEAWAALRICGKPALADLDYLAKADLPPEVDKADLAELVALGLADLALAAKLEHKRPSTFESEASASSRWRCKATILESQ